MTATRTAIADNLAAVRERIATAAHTHARNPDDIRLVAVSKTKPVELLRAALEAGQRDLGENYLQEALAKIDALTEYEPLWHYIGRIQSNKSRDIAECFDWVHTVDRFKIARRLSEQRPPGLAPLNLCIQVNIDDEQSKSGIAPNEAFDLAAAIVKLDNIRLRGLMTLPAPASGFEAQRKPFAALRELRDALRVDGFELDALSMGMSADLEAAIAEGATHVRVGSAIFGARG